MKPTLFLALSILALACLSRPASAAPETGVTMSLTEKGYEFTPRLGGPLPPPTGTAKCPAPQGFDVSATLKNGTSAGIQLVIDSGINFEFTVYNAQNQQVWDSLPQTIPKFQIVHNLASGATLSGSAFVPLFINGQPLPAGNYVLVATFFGLPEFSATTTFVVNQGIPLN